MPKIRLFLRKMQKKSIGIFILIGLVFLLLFIFKSQVGDFSNLISDKLFPLKIKINKIGWISDIHADRFKRREVDTGLLYPKKYLEYLPKVFEDLKAQNINLVLATGDNTNSSGVDYAKDILSISKEEKVKVLWVKGNHDGDDVMKALGFNKGVYYYFEDFGKTRIIVLDDTQEQYGNYMNGGMSPVQIKWLSESLKTDKEVIVAMHIPIINNDGVLPEYKEVEKILTQSGNVKEVLAGHLHTRWEKQYNGLAYYGESALTRDKEEGGYSIIDLGNYLLTRNYAK